jgi:sec-independent protein translocase protein TatC
VTPKFLIKNVRYAVLLTAVTAAALAPTPDWTTLFMFWIPMVGLYVVSIGLSWLVYVRKRWRAKRAVESDQ